MNDLFLVSKRHERYFPKSDLHSVLLSHASYHYRIAAEAPNYSEPSVIRMFKFTSPNGMNYYNLSKVY